MLKDIYPFDVFHGVSGARIKVRGSMSNANIEETCLKNKMKPLCDSYDVIGQRCQWVGGQYTQSLTDPNNNQAQQVSKAIFRFAWLYGSSVPVVNFATGRRNTKYAHPCSLLKGNTEPLLFAGTVIGMVTLCAE